ncbi:hypothetical protein F5Y18DRAFT_306923 [Xylariaceae sp. FL1019]|nr:hypothetical protein F5Y18DRAFT_306923 [Xylariaceae sp. FL1019]
MSMSSSSRRLSSRGTMPAIEEVDYESSAPDLPRRSSMRARTRTNSHTNRSLNGNLNVNGGPPPPYSVGVSRWSRDTSLPPAGPPTPEPPKDRRPAWYVKRGGWIRIVLFVLLGVLAIVALVAGLVLGLRAKRNSDKSSSTQSPEQTQETVFPAGSYSFITALANISTACTTNSATFRCYPYATYDASSANSSMATFLWTIAENTTNSSYGISSSQNPFQPTFGNISMDFLDENQDTERLTFELGNMMLQVLPVDPVTGDDGSTAASCYFNDTVLSATIWTRKAGTYPMDLDTSVDNMGNGTHISEDFDPWPYAVEISQTAAAGAGVPDCRDAQGNPVGNFEISHAGGDCGCYYRNFDLGT